MATDRHEFSRLGPKERAHRNTWVGLLAFRSAQRLAALKTGGATSIVNLKTNRMVLSCFFLAVEELTVVTDTPRCWSSEVSRPSLKGPKHYLYEKCTWKKTYQHEGRLENPSSVRPAAESAVTCCNLWRQEKAESDKLTKLVKMQGGSLQDARAENTPT